MRNVEEKMPKYLILETDGPTLRHDVIGYTCEDTRQIELHQPIGLSGEARGDYMYSTVLHALASGWRLLGQPTEMPSSCDDGKPTTTWWLTDDNQPTLIPSQARNLSTLSNGSRHD